MKRSLLLPLGLATLLPAARAATLTELLPAGALMTLETRDASGAIGRLAGLLGSTMDATVGPDDDMTRTLNGMQELLKGSIGQEAAVGVFTVGRPGQPYTPHLLAVSRLDDLSSEFFGSTMKARPGARVGGYTFARQGSVYAGMAGGLVYMSTDKTLLMSYLGRLSGKAAPRLLDSAAYTAARRPVGAQEFSLYLNFSATARVIRGYLGRSGLPRLFAPVVDAIDTLGQYAAGFTTTDAGLTAASAHAANAQGKDQPLYRLLTHSTDFHVQNIIPASTEAVSARACAPETGAYTARWLNRLDLFEPLGFLSDSQLASHLERAGQYLGDECAQVTLAGGFKAGLDTTTPRAGLAHTVTYQSVRDLDAAKKHMPEYAASLNAAIAGLGGSLRPLLNLGSSPLARSLPGGLKSPGGMDGAALDSGVKQLEELLGGLKLVYAFRGNYLITAWSDEALKAALDETAAPLAQDAAFQAAGLGMSGAGWSYQPDRPEISAEEFSALVNSALADQTDRSSGDDEQTDADLTEEERAMQAAIAKLGSQRRADTTQGEMLDGIGPVVTDIVNRFDGLTGQSRVQGNVILGKTRVAFRWE